MSLREQIDQDLKAAMRAREQLRLDVLRQIKSAMRYLEVEQLKACDDAAILKIMASLVKQRHEAITLYTQGGRADLVAKEQTELAILQHYLPEALSETALVAIIDRVIQAEGAAGPKDMGRVMKPIMAEVAGRADGKLISRLVQDRLKPIAT